VQAGEPDEEMKVAFCLDRGDKTFIEVSLGGGENEEDKKEKTKVGSLYMVVKDLQKMSGGSTITMTGHGKLEVSTGPTL
jgi:hypothetical protein